LADRRLGDSLSTLSSAPRKKVEPEAGQPSVSADEPLSASKREPNKAQREAGPQNRPQEPVPGKDLKADSLGTDSTKPDPKVAETAGEPGASGDQKPAEQKPSDPKTDRDKTGDLNSGERKTDDKQPSEQPTGSLDALKAVPNALAEQAAKALPRISAELLKKAAELRANELSPADIEKLRKAAESLSRDLAPITQSKELQQALQEMARQIRPEQIEQVARELGNQEKLKQELDAAARLLMEKPASEGDGCGASWAVRACARREASAGQPPTEPQIRDGRRRDSLAQSGVGQQQSS
jgi:hypothetical protein